MGWRLHSTCHPHLGKTDEGLGVDGLFHENLTEGMMGGQDPLSFIPFHLGADKQSNSQTGTWVQSWWLSKKGAKFGPTPEGGHQGQHVQVAGSQGSATLDAPSSSHGGCTGAVM